ncbi:uncharacterized protein LOC110836415 isoform X1 [Zootermopsis nevadensis]|uniref:uncharacterized protein LOC110836415 isoform X1 n=1 Tax=Zootermopsis nevadensis TaxID=136037 RepID=UPI000B8E88EA|nr:uncharacterized protein LOC110836415 isoform X1 [Zootermopsis nevadensis]XP_021933258.1 uncharacterized protein LOC110836415 isoform X1 [Zootermopsis nevadensis]XP_021933259.1 uncharacterized protein LOC110836415 isoform X1 [Zootermopsis nevadensis]
MQSEPGRYINSVSDLYGTDEIEVLLEEIRDLEPASCRLEDIQDFEIAGSQTGVATAAENDCESPAVTVRSWDSHANYHHQLPGSSPTASLFSGVILYCDESHLKSSTGVVRVLLVISSVACLACLCSSGTVKAGLFMLPLIGRLRLMMFVTVFSLLVTCLFIFLDISHIVYFFPFNWGKVNAFFYVSVSVLYVIGSSLVIHLIHMYHESYSWVPKWTRDQLLVTGVNFYQTTWCCNPEGSHLQSPLLCKRDKILGYLCAIEALVLSIITRHGSLQYSPVDEDPSQVTHQERRDRELHPMTRSRSPSSTSLQLQVPPTKNQLPSQQQKQQHWVALASTSAPAPRMWPVDDVQPCSSKYPDPYTVA